MQPVSKTWMLLVGSDLAPACTGKCSFGFEVILLLGAGRGSGVEMAFIAPWGGAWWMEQLRHLGFGHGASLPLQLSAPR